MGVRSSGFRIVLNALVLMGIGCRVGAATAIAPARGGAVDAGVHADPSTAGAVGEPPGDASAPAPSSSGARDAPDAADSAPTTRPCANVDTCEVPTGCTAAEFGEHAYFVCSQKLSWDDARGRCRAADTDLVIVDDEAENMFVAGAVSAPSWIGLHDRDAEGDYRWMPPGSTSRDGASVSFANWAPATPDNCGAGIFGQQDCVRIARDGTWNDSHCGGGCFEGAFAFVCESF